ncbi:23S rRNA (uracil(1939)-C(5))-methyltransferase RlmD [Candidatus Methylospira mobilis]|uniref:23S rRNA (uracil(1939)-C(5))-methyltransferase RlmD n=1 Tax=Candidatus Methylospira mobilis TaxID=1808979 RepID=A0A5Q0BT66_9GAMM|nr:23S rRNA (uracil(1939)-C(5))-methyltransferase RlmD [Candidatus Methylospira mobilis]QFY44856.1 23S rRNA (uracil(1939)-C(5))-methyltransferase RlmD [Candidatus Methylospira mobilis]
MSRRPTSKPLPTQPVNAAITSFAHDGRGVAHVNGKATFIHGALPGEEVDFVYTGIHRDYDEGRVDAVHMASPDRVEPHCAHYGICGGCSLQHLGPEAQVAAKQALLQDQLQRIGKVEPASLLPPLTCPVWGYRQKARLSVKYVAKKGRVLVGFRERASPLLAALDHCPVLHPDMGTRLLELGDVLIKLSVRDRVPQLEVAIGEAEGRALIIRLLAELTEEDREILRAYEPASGFTIYLQRQGPDSVQALSPEKAPPLFYSLPDHDLRFEFLPNDFTQVNFQINRLMVERVLALLDLQPSDKVLDLYCGLGNFTLPMARQAQHVTGVEGSKVSVERARHNALLNGGGNVEFHVADLATPQDKSPWAQSRYDKALLDPSRAGAFEILQYMKNWQPSRVVYVSCNPSTLARDAGYLVNELGYRLAAAGIMDMFPHTSHVESLAVFEK